MRYSFFLAFYCICSLMSAQVPTNGLVGQWLFSGNANDVSGSNNNGIVSGAILTNDRCGIPNSAYRFDGINDNIVMQAAGPTGSVSRSLSFWAKTSNTGLGPRSSFDYGTATGAGDSYQVVWNYCSQGVGLDLSNQALIRSNSCLENNAWHHIAIVYDAAISTVYSSVVFYVDGVVQSNIVCNVSGTTAVINTGVTSPITIGSGATSFVRYWQGDLDDFFLYNRALTQAEVLQLYNLSPCTASVTGSPIPCVGTAVYSIEPISNVTYTWTLSNGYTGTSTTNSINVGGSGFGGTITVAYSSAACNFSGTATGTLNLGYSPTVTGFSITSNSPLCAGTTLNLLTSVPSSSYSWSGPNGFSSAAQNPTLANTGVASSGVYSLTLLDAGCSTATVSVTVNPRPTVTITNVSGSSSLTCVTPSIDLLASTNYTFGNLDYYWSSNSFTSSNQSVNITSPSTLITVLVTDPATGCASSKTIAIGIDQVAPTSSVNPVNQNILCGPGVVATVTGTAINPTVNVTHSWYTPGISVPVQGGGQYSILGLGCVGIFTYVLTNNVNGCSTTKTVQVTSSLGYPVFTVTSPPPYDFTVGCSSTSLAVLHITDQDTRPLTGGSMSFAILPPGYSSPTYTYSSILDYTVSTPGNYTLIVQDNSNQCETRITVPIIQDIFPPDVLVNAATRTLTCLTPSTILEGVNTATAVSYSWSFQNGANPNTVPNATTIVNTTTNTAVSATVVNVYTLTVTNENNQCKTSTLVSMYQNIRPPKPKINGAGGLDCLNFEQTLVNGSSLDEAPGFFTPLGTAAIKWEGPSPQETNTDTVSSYKAQTVGIYTMTVMDRNNGCVTQTTVLIPDNKIYPVLQTASLVALDCGASSTGVSLSVTAVGLKPGDITSIWTTPFPTPGIKNPNTLTLTTDGAGDYTLSVTTNSNGCKSDIHVTVTNGILNAGFTPDKDNGFAPLTVNFTNSSSSTSSITGTSSVTSVWSFGNGTTRTTTTNVVTSAVYNQPGTYTVTMFASKGTCSDTIVKVIHVDIPSKLEIPNIFTPNGDNSNDVFFVKAANLDEITALIYDRWGSKVYEVTTDKGNIAWDGKNLQGKDSPDGTYYYIISAKGKDGQNYDLKGTVTLVR